VCALCYRWALLNFLLPTIFDSPETFDQWFNKPFASFAGQEQVALRDEEKLLIINRLHELLRPFMLRRVKSAVMGQLPTKVEKVLKCELSGYQRMLYKDITNKCLRSKGITTSMNNILMHLRKCCNHPFLFQDSYAIDYSIISSSGKMELLDRILPKLKAAGHRILLFSQMTQAMDILDDYFKFRGYRFLRLDGSTSADDREQRMYQFNAPDSPYFIFSLSTRAGGLGLNLATADTVIFFDSDWNPSMDSQAMDRAHRIGQKNDVKVFRLITNTSVEEKIISRASEKSKLTNMVVEAGKFNRDSKEGERRAMLESLLLRDANEQEEGTEESTVPDDDQLNDMMASSAEELELYRRMDVEREDLEQNEWDAYMRSQGKDPLRHPKPPRLSPDIPKGAVVSGLLPGAPEDDLMSESVGGKRKRKDVVYADNLTDRQYARLLEKNAEEEERMKQNSKRDKKPKLPDHVYDDMLKLYNSIRTLKDPEDGRQLCLLFLDKPPKKDYPDYYRIIKTPIDLKTIRQQIKNKEYRDTDSFAASFRLLFTNAFTYNLEESLVYQDAKKMQEHFETKYAELASKWAANRESTLTLKGGKKLKLTGGLRPAGAMDDGMAVKRARVDSMGSQVYTPFSTTTQFFA